MELEKPPMLAYVSRDYLKKLGYGPHPIWESSQRHLSAPTEAHLVVTNRCDMGCRGCYTASSPKGDSGELSYQQWIDAFKMLAEMGLFHVALGGGESILREDLFDIAAYARKLGLVPNLTTNGHLVTEDIARRCRIFGQVNVSIDGVREYYAANRGAGSYERALEGLKRLRKAGVRAGINAVVSRKTFSQMEPLTALAKKLKLHDVEFLRYKPGGRASAVYEDYRLTEEQGRNFYPILKGLAKKYRMPLKLDCSFVPHVACHYPDKEAMQFFGVLGCEGGNHLVGVKSTGTVTACSFIHQKACDISEFADQWQENAQFKAFRDWDLDAPEPCASCRYLEQCKGGCHAVSLYYYKDIDHPDPECPLVVEWSKENKR